MPHSGRAGSGWRDPSLATAVNPVELRSHATPARPTRRKPTGRTNLPMIPARLRPDPLGRSSKRSKRLTTTGCKWVSANARRYEADEEGREGEVRPEPLGVSEERAEDGAEARPDDPVDPEGRAH